MKKTCVLYEFDKNAVVQGNYEIITSGPKELSPNFWRLAIEISGYSSYHGQVDAAGEDDSKSLFRESNAPMKGSFVYVASDGDQQICFFYNVQKQS